MNPAVLRQAYLDACETELQAFKPGNVSVHAEGHDMTVADFRASAAASAPHLVDATLPLGRRIEAAIGATRDAVPCNTNLGIVLLCAPMLAAALGGRNGDWRGELQQILQNTTVADAEAVFRAIVAAAPGGLGEVGEQDVRDLPTVTLLEAMRLAAGRDRIAYQYVSCYADVFGIALPAYRAAREKGREESWSALAAYAALLRRIPDSHVERKFGARFNPLIQERMTRIDVALNAFGDPGPLLQLLQEADVEFKSFGINPGTSADLTVACLLAARLDVLAQK
ncbi:MAG TPA: triphosphoribosyl-dephospho-CoA synthase [Methylococcaceae bacterium]|nr:triphosphoribosyl-dephospho-CoA synthase [Methylococcaceae bacterium]